MCFRNFCLVFTATTVLYSCDSTNQEHASGAIVLGDSSMIVTETDPQYLTDFVTDFKAPPPSEQQAPVQQASASPTDTPSADVAITPPAADQAERKGLSVDFKDIKVFIPGIETRTYSGSLRNNNSASFQLTDGKLNGNRIEISGGTAERISQRYQTSVIMNHESGNLVLESLNYTSGWAVLKGTKEIRITGLETQDLRYTKASRTQIRNAVQKAARSKRFSRQKEQDYLNDIKNTNAVNQKPLEVVLRTVIWQISGKDSKGRPFHKELRMDMSI